MNNTKGGNSNISNIAIIYSKLDGEKSKIKELDIWSDLVYEDFDFLFDEEVPKSNTIESLPYNIANSNTEVFEENFDVYEYFGIYNQLFFDDKLGCVRLEWSKRMTLCAGIFSVRGGELVIRLSEPLLKFRSVNEIKETLIHEMIHAWCHVEDFDQSDDRSGHGVHFKTKMYEINKNTGLNITVYHSFHDEVDYHRKHVWRCDGKCRNEKPYFGWVRRAMNRPPGKYDRWFSDHEKNCGGKFSKIEEEQTSNLEVKHSDLLKNDEKINKESKENKNKQKTKKIVKNKTLDGFINVTPKKLD